MNQLPFDRQKGRENYAAWKIGARAHLITRGLWSYCETEVTSKQENPIKDEKALTELTLMVDSYLYTHLEGSEHAKNGWTESLALFQSQIAGALMLCGLPETYKPMVMEIEAKPENITIGFVKNVLMQEIDYDHNETLNALAARAKKKPKSKPNRKIVKCFKCGGPHFKRKCPKLKKDQVVFVAENSPTDSVFDSGATKHMTNDDSSINKQKVE